LSELAKRGIKNHTSIPINTDVFWARSSENAVAFRLRLTRGNEKNLVFYQQGSYFSTAFPSNLYLSTRGSAFILLLGL
jgi:hypothetical protein